MRISDWSSDVCSSDLILYSVRGIFGSILGTIVMYTIFRPMFLYIMDKWKLQKNFAAIFIILFSFLVIILPILGVGSMVVSKIVEIQENPQWIQQVIQQISDFAGDKLHQPDLIEDVLRNKIGRASCRERVCKYVYISGVAEVLTKKKRKK